jgi:mannose-1-phosphate guanylyltransferase
VLDRIAGDRKVSIEREVFPAMVNDGVLFAHDDGGAYWIDTGTPVQYLDAMLDLLDGKRGTAPTAVDPGATVDPIVALAAAQIIVAVAAVQRIVAVSADQEVMVVVAVQRVVARPAALNVVAGKAVDGVVARRAD